MESAKVITFHARRFFSGTVLSRIFGMFRDILMALLFGTSAEISTFLVAYRLSNIFRRLLAESPLSSSVIPFFEKKKKASQKHSAEFFRDLFYSYSIVILGFVVLAEIGVVSLWYYLPDTSSMKETMYLIAWMFPALFFISLFGLCSAYLQCEGQFFIPGVSPVIFNLVWMLFSLIAWHYSSQKLSVLCIGVVCGFLAQFVLSGLVSLKLLTKELSSKEIRAPNLFQSELKDLLKPFFMGLIGISASQLNSALDAIFAKFSSSSGPSYLWYSIRLQQVPVAFFGVAIAAASLPMFSKLFQSSEEEYSSTVGKMLSKTFLLMSFSFVGLLFVGKLALSLIFERGAFDFQSVVNTSTCLWCYVLGLIPMGFVMVLSSAFYAQKNYKIPMIASILSVVCNLILNTVCVFVFELDAWSVALSTSVSSLFNAFLLWVLLRRQFFVKLPVFNLVKTVIGIGVASFLTFAIANQVLGRAEVLSCVIPELTFLVYGVFERLKVFILLSTLFLGSFFGVCFFLKHSEVRELFMKGQLLNKE